MNCRTTGIIVVLLAVSSCTHVEYVPNQKRYLRNSDPQFTETTFVSSLHAPKTSLSSESHHAPKKSVTLARYQISEDKWYEIDGKREMRETNATKTLPPHNKRSEVTFSIVKKDAQSLGNLYFSNQVSASKELLALHLSKEKSAYKASVPIFLNDETGKSSKFSLSLQRRGGLFAGFEFRLDLHPWLKKH